LLRAVTPAVLQLAERFLELLPNLSIERPRGSGLRGHRHREVERGHTDRARTGCGNGTQE
jgi:hypothetical protein